MKYVNLLVVISVLLFVACGEQKEETRIKESDAATEEDYMVNGDSLRLEEKLKNLNAQLKENPNDLNLYQQRAFVWYQLGVKDAALHDANLCIEQDSTVASFYYTRGFINYRTLAYEEASRDFEKAAELDEEYVKPRVKLGEIYFTIKNYKKSLHYINEALKLNPTSAEGYFLKGMTLEEGGDTTAATSSYQTAVDMDPNYFEAYQRLGVLHTRKGENDIAKNFFIAAISVEPNNILAHYNLGKCHQDLMELDEAIEQYNKVISLDSTFLDAHHNKAIVYFMKADALSGDDPEFNTMVNKAKLSFDIMLAMDSLNTRAILGLGVVDEALGRKQDAKEKYLKVLDIKPNDPDAIRALNDL